MRAVGCELSLRIRLALVPEGEESFATKRSGAPGKRHCGVSPS